jgi:hypothetical protein
MGFEPRIPVFEHEKAIHALDRAVIVIGISPRDTDGNYEKY